MSKILSMLHNKSLFSIAENEVAKFILSDPQRIIYMSVREIAAKTYTSPTTIMRLAKKICDGGFAEFRIELAKEIQTAKVSYHSDHRQEAMNKKMDDLTQIMNELKTCIVQSIESTRLLINAQIIETIITLINQSSVIDIYGRGSSNSVGLDFRYKLYRLGYNVQIYEGIDLQAIQAYNSNEDHCAIIISSTGETPEIVNFAKILNQRKTPVVTITGSQDCTLLQYSDYPLFFQCYESNQKVGGITSRNAQQYVCDTIYFSILNNNFDAFSEKILNNYIPAEIASKDFRE